MINSETEDIVQRTLEVTGGTGAYAGVDPIAGEMTGRVVTATRKQGVQFSSEK